MSESVEAIFYVHTFDGERYKHEFGRGNARMFALKDGSILIKPTRGKKLHALFDV